MNKKIKIDHVAKSEGHMGFMAHVVNNDVKKARLEVHEGARLIEGLLIGRQFDEAPIITSRICGLCPIVHNITSIKAIEKALDIQVSEQTKLLRELLLFGQIIQSHTLHLFMLSENKKILPIRDWINKFLRIIAGRAIHPLTTQVGGFRKLPDVKVLKKLFKDYNKILKLAKKLVPEFQDQPDFYRKTEYRALDTIYGNGVEIIPDEIQQGIVKRTSNTYMLGAIARLHLYNYEHDLSVPCYNTFYNIYAQAIENVHFLRQIKSKIKFNFKQEKNSFKIKAGSGIAACEAPRGTLYHSYEIDSNGKILQANIVPPTAQFLNNLEADLKKYLEKNWDKEKAKELIRAYDPCISCAVH